MNMICKQQLRGTISNAEGDLVQEDTSKELGTLVLFDTSIQI